MHTVPLTLVIGRRETNLLRFGGRAYSSKMRPSWSNLGHWDTFTLVRNGADLNWTCLRDGHRVTEGEIWCCMNVKEIRVKKKTMQRLNELYIKIEF